jgi:hypothetical protein
MCSTAQLLYLLHSEFRNRERFAIDIEFYSQVPIPCPCRNTCPSLGYSRRHGLFKAFFLNSAIITRHSRRRTIGTPMNRRLLVVSIVSLYSLSSLRYRLPPTFHIDNIEYGPGAIFGAAGVSTPSTNAPSSSTGAPSPTPGHPKGNTSHGGKIVGFVVGGIAAISIIIAIFYLWRRRSQSASAAVGTSQPMQIAHLPLGSPHVRVFKFPRLCVFMRHFLTISIHLEPRSRWSSGRTPKLACYPRNQGGHPENYIPGTPRGYRK